MTEDILNFYPWKCFWNSVLSNARMLWKSITICRIFIIFLLLIWNLKKMFEKISRCESKPVCSIWRGKAWAFVDGHIFLYFRILNHFRHFLWTKSTLNRISENSQRENSEIVKVFGSNLRGREPVISQSARRKFSSATSGKSAWEK